MTNRPRRIGTAAESLVTQMMRGTWWPDARRHGLNGSKDIGDINTGNPKLVVEVKADKALDYPRFLRETEAERINAQADIGVCVIKPPGVGARKMDQWWMLFSDNTWNLLHGEPGDHSNHYVGPTILWTQGHADLGRAFHPGKWMTEAEKIIEQMRIVAYPGAHKISRAIGGMRFIPLPVGLDLLGSCGYGDKR